MSRPSQVRPSARLRFALRTDAIGCAVFALGVALLGAPLLWSMVRREHLRRSSVRILMAGNLLWAIISVLAVAAGWIEPTALGAAIIIGQGIATGLIAEMEFIGLRRSDAALVARLTSDQLA